MTDLQRDISFFTETSEIGISLHDFASALQIWVFMRGSHTTVRGAASEFQVTEDVVRRAVEENRWLIVTMSGDGNEWITAQ